jgi:hypothetical protein
MVLFLRSLLFYIGMILALVVWCIIITPLILPLPYRWRYLIMIRWGIFVVWWRKKNYAKINNTCEPWCRYQFAN